MNQLVNAVQSAIRTGREVAGNNRLLSYAVAAVLAFLVLTGRVGFSLPAWWPIALVAMIAAWYAGKDAARRIDDELDDPKPVWLISYGGERVDKFTPDEWAEQNVAGTLYPWEESPERAYECAYYHPERDWIVANWKESFPGSEVGKETTAEDAIQTVEEFRKNFEPELAEARAIKRGLRGIVRRLDRERALEQEAILDEHTAPTFGEGKTITEVIAEELPEDLHPKAVEHSVKEDTEDEEADDGPDPEQSGAEQPAATDGGEPDA